MAIAHGRATCGCVMNMRVIYNIRNRQFFDCLFLFFLLTKFFRFDMLKKTRGVPKSKHRGFGVRERGGQKRGYDKKAGEEKSKWPRS